MGDGYRHRALVGGLDVARLRGLELGPLDKPMVAKSAGSVVYVDHHDADTIREKYKDEPDVDGSAIHVDVALKGRSLGEAVRHLGPFDYVVASHVIEHVPDLVGFLVDLKRVLREGGQVRLAIPDRRYTFDFLRRTSDIAEVLAAHLEGARRPRAQAVLDHYLHVAEVSVFEAWASQIDPERLVCGRALKAIAAARAAQDRCDYADVHTWVFTPHAFADVMLRLAEHGLQPFACDAFADTRPNTLEFFVSLRPAEDRERLARGWQKMMSIAHHHEPCRSRAAPGQAGLWETAALLRRRAAMDEWVPAAPSRELAPP